MSQGFVEMVSGFMTVAGCVHIDKVYVFMVMLEFNVYPSASYRVGLYVES